MTELMGAVFVASVLGSLHCAAMCGVFVAHYAGGDASGGRRRMLGHLAYSGGRLATYLTLGVLAGALGSGLDLAGEAAGLSPFAALLAGAVIVAGGLVGLLRALGVRLPAAGRWRLLQRLTIRATRGVAGRPPLVRAALLGLSTTLLPCGWLYAFVAAAAGTASPLRGAALMIAFWAGTLPVLVGLGALVGRVAFPVRRWAPVVTALALIGVGLAGVATRPVLAAADGAAAEQPCCHSRAEAGGQGG